MNLSKFQAIAEELGTILCFGIDPEMQRILGASDQRPPGQQPERMKKDKGNLPEDNIFGYFAEITDKLIAECQISAIKPNYAYFAQYGFEGLKALKKITDNYKNKIPIILDGKRGDIEKSSRAYARELYDFWNADAITVSPYMGEDSVTPFLRDDKIVYMLCRTSNPGASDFQELRIGNKYLYEKVAEKAIEWRCGLVVGATSGAIKRIVKITDNELPLLIPGIGAQRGDLKTVIKAIKGNLFIHRISASSSISYAYEKNRENAPAAALAEAKILNEKIKKFM